MSNGSSRFLLCLFVLTGAALGQTQFGRISGTVTDPSGAVVAGAAVQIGNTDTHATRVEKTVTTFSYVEEYRDLTANGLQPRLRAISYWSRILCMPRGNPSPKLAITIDPKVHERILAAAAREGVSVSAWMTSAAREALQRRAGLAAVADWEKQYGPFSAEEMDEARHRVRAQLQTARPVRRLA